MIHWVSFWSVPNKRLLFSHFKANFKANCTKSEGMNYELSQEMVSFHELLFYRSIGKQWLLLLNHNFLALIFLWRLVRNRIKIWKSDVIKISILTTTFKLVLDISWDLTSLPRWGPFLFIASFFSICQIFHAKVSKDMAEKLHCIAILTSHSNQTQIFFIREAWKCFM